MNILIFVMSMLMIFALMTYARVDSYRTSAALENEFTRYMEVVERAYINMAADKAYVRMKVSSEPAQQPQKPTAPKNKDNLIDDPEPRPKTRSYGRLNILPLLDPEVREKDPKAYNETVEIFKNLIKTLYGNQKQFQAELKKRPTLVEEIIDALSKAAESLPQNMKIKDISEISNLELDGGLEEPFYRMLKGCPNPSLEPTLADNTDETEDTSEESDEIEEYVSEKSWDALRNFITLQKPSKINIFLAPRALLQAIYENPATAEAIVEARYRLYKAVKSGEMSAEEASQKLKNEFHQGGEDSLLDYKVTGTNPWRYN